MEKGVQKREIDVRGGKGKGENERKERDGMGKVGTEEIHSLRPLKSEILGLRLDAF